MTCPLVPIVERIWIKKNGYGRTAIGSISTLHWNEPSMPGHNSHKICISSIDNHASAFLFHPSITNSVYDGADIESIQITQWLEHNYNANINLLLDVNINYENQCSCEINITPCFVVICILDWRHRRRQFVTKLQRIGKFCMIRQKSRF